MTRAALVVRGGWEGHAPVAATDLFIPGLRANGYAVDIADSSDAYADGEYLAGVDLILQCYTMGSIEPQQFAGLEAAVRAGTGFAGWHGGIIDSYRNTPAYCHMVGGQFACHPAKAADECAGVPDDFFLPHQITMLPAAREHPITAGIDDFDLSTEQYWVLTDPYNDVLATTTVPARDGDPWRRPVTSPAIWTRRWGAGKIFVITAGHSLDVLQHSSVRTVIERGLRWASR
jgi:type 1 glutamine amidotransferase